MMFQLFRRKSSDVTIGAIYGTIVAQARLPAFYEVYGVPDTVEGRFEMVVLHLSLAMRRFERDRRSGRALFERFCVDMDHNLRELGVSDLAVPRKMKGFAEAYFGRAKAYDLGLATAGGELAASIARNVFGEDAVSAGAVRLGAYMREAAAQLDRTDDRRRIQFPDPASIAELHVDL